MSAQRRCVGSEFHSKTGTVTLLANKKKEMFFAREKKRDIFHYGVKYFEEMC